MFKNSTSYRFLLAVILALSMIGLGYGAWNGVLGIDSTVSTGDIDPVFSAWQIDLVAGDGKGIVTAMNGRQLYVDLDAYPQDVYDLMFKITNQGSLPVKYKVVTNATEAPRIEWMDEPNSVILPQHQSQGRLRISIGDVSESYEASFIVQLIFTQ